jgi:Ca2+-binding EF-hand superfamily protein
MPLFDDIRSGFLAAFFVLAGAGPALSQQLAVAPTLAPNSQFLLRIHASQTLEQYLQFVRGDFFSIDADVDGQITQRDVDLHTVMETVQGRTSAVSHVMRYDLDGDGSVTEDEIRHGMSYDMRSQRGLAAFNKIGKPQLPSMAVSAMQIETAIRSIMAVDADKDGKVTVAEAARFGVPGRGGRPESGQAARARQVLTLDSGTKAAVTLAEYQAAGELLFRNVDTDNDGIISQQELTGYRARAERAGCEMPAASEKAKVILLSSYRTDALSSVTLGSQDKIVNAGRVVVEAGSEPLYVVIATHSPTIWQFTGAVERIERLVMSSSPIGSNSGVANQRSAVGATGVPQERVSFFARANCLTYFPETPTGASLQTVAAVHNFTGKAPETVAARHSVASFKVPSGAIETRVEQRSRSAFIRTTEGTRDNVGNTSNVMIQAGPRRAKDEMDLVWPGGVIEIDPRTVVGSASAVAYEVLPAPAGLVQLLSAGTLTQNSLGEYIVRQKMRFPAGLQGAQTFLIMRGTPYPDGDPGHSCVIVEETGEKKGATCPFALPAPQPQRER